MATLSSFFGDAQGSGEDTSIIIDPRKLPFYHTINEIQYKYGDGHAWYGSSTDNFWYYWYSNNGANYTAPGGNNTQIDNNGTMQDSSTFPRLGADMAQYDSASYAGEWVTVMDHSNEAGNLCYVKGFGAYGVTTNTTTSDKCISKIRITVDGTAYTFQTLLRTHNDISGPTLGHSAPTWGHFGRGGGWHHSYGGRGSNSPGAEIGDHTSNSWFNYGQQDEFGVYDMTERGTPYIFNATWFVEGRLPSVRYSNSIKVECAINKYTDTATNGTGTAGRTQHYYTHRAYAKRIADPIVLL